MSIKSITAALERNGISYREDLPEKLEIYMLLLSEWNKKMDLTAVDDEEEIIDKHFADSLSVLKTGLLTNESELIDVGTGAGFPGMVIAMAMERVQVTLLDSQQKRLVFLEKVCSAASVRNVSLIHARAEDGARKPELREYFDFATARALAPLNVLCEYLLPYVKTGGYALCWKGPALKEELETGRKAAHLLGGSLEIPVSSPVAGREWGHMILPIKKTQHTPAVYPRKAGIPKNKPLGL